MLDVLIIGGGPHALTLASLLSRPDPDPNSDHGSDPLLSHSCSDSQRPRPNPEASNYNCCSGKRKRRTKAVSSGQTVEEKFAELKTSERIPYPPISLRVVDAYGQWTALWESQFSALNIPHLRSHTLVHTDPFNKRAFQEYVQTNGRSAELHSLPDQVYILDQHAFFNDMRLGKKEKKRLRVASTLKNSLSLSLPGTQLSLDFFKEQVRRYKLDEVLVKGTVERIIPVMEDEKRTDDEQKGDGGAENLPGGARKRVKHFRVHLREGDVLEASRVVVATGPTREQMANIPSWVRNVGESYPEERLQHTVNLMHRLPKFRQKISGTDRQTPEETCSPHGLYVVCEAGQRVMVVGGGLTSAHVVSIALRQGASHVTWVMRKHLQLKQFDVGDVESLVGRYSHVEHGIKLDGQAYLRQFYNERSLHKRLAMIRQARKGGAVTPEAYTHLQPFILSGQVEVKAYCQVSEASWDYKNQAWSLSLSTGDHWTGDMIWLATGCKLDVKEDSLLSEVIKEFPIQVIDGWPCISESLQWTAGCPLYLMGQYTALQVGPHAVNLAGGQAASMRITKDIMFRQLQDATQALNTNGDKSKTENYVQQMRGLLWL